MDKATKVDVFNPKSFSEVIAKLPEPLQDTVIDVLCETYGDGVVDALSNPNFDANQSTNDVFNPKSFSEIIAKLPEPLQDTVVDVLYEKYGDGVVNALRDNG